MTPLEKRLILQNMLDPSINKFEKGMKVYYVPAVNGNTMYRLKPYGIVDHIHNDQLYIKISNEHFNWVSKESGYVHHKRLLILTESDFV